MIMEAMRLSLVEHEEHQRREAANREQDVSTNAETTPASNTDVLPAIGRSDSHPGSRPSTPAPLSILAPPIAPIPTSSIQPASSLLQDHLGSSFNAEGITPKNRSLTPNSTSRNRTPSPVHASRILQPSSESSNNWRRRSSSPRTFSTIAAAMSATSTATAILANTESTGLINDSSSSSVGGCSASPRATNHDLAAAQSALLDPASIPVSRSSDDLGTPKRPPIPIERESYMSSIFSADSTSQNASSPYDVLNSSTDSDFSREPLLGSPVTQTSDADTSREIMSSGAVEEVFE